MFLAAKYFQEFIFDGHGTGESLFGLRSDELHDRYYLRLPFVLHFVRFAAAVAVSIGQMISKD